MNSVLRRVTRVGAVGLLTSSLVLVPLRAGAAAAADTPELAPQWTVVDSLSDRSALLADRELDSIAPVLVTPDVLLTSDNRLFHGPDYRELTYPEDLQYGFVTPAAFLDGRFSWVGYGDTTLQVYSQRLDGSDAQSYPTENVIAALVPDGWLEVRGAGNDVVFDEVQAADGVIRSRTEVGRLDLGGPADLTQLNLFDQLYTEAGVGFDIQPDSDDGVPRSLPVRYDFAAHTATALAPYDEVAGDVQVRWNVASVNGSDVLLTGYYPSSGAAGWVRLVTGTGDVTTWTADDVGPFFVGHRPVWYTPSDTNGTYTQGNPDGSVTDLGAAPWFAGSAGVLSVGDIVYSRSYRDGVVRSDPDGGNAVPIAPGHPRAALDIGDLSLDAGTLSWTDDAQVTDGRFSPGPQFQAWSAALTPYGPTARRPVDGDVLGSGISGHNGTVVVAHRTPEVTVDAVTPDGERRSLSAPGVPATVRAASDAEVLISTESPDGTELRTLLAGGAAVPTAVTSLNDAWRVRVDSERSIDGHSGTDTVVITSTATGADRAVFVDSPGLVLAHLVGDTLVWTRNSDPFGDGGGTRTVYWQDLTTPGVGPGSAVLNGFASVDAIEGHDGWFTVAGRGDDGVVQVRLFEVGYPEPVATLAGATGVVDLDDEYVAWVVDGPQGDRLVAAALPASRPAPPVTPAPGTFMPLPPVRLTAADATVPGDGVVSVPVAGSGGVPADAAVVALRVGVVGPTASGHLSVVPDVGAAVTTSTVNFAAGQTVSNLAMVPVGSDGSVVVRNGAPGPTGLTVDVVGWFTAGQPIAGGAYVPVPATRVADSRTGLGVSGPIAAGDTASLAPLNRFTVSAAQADSVVVNVTAVAPTGFGHLLVFPSGTEPPAVSTLNVDPDRTVANLVTVPVGADGKISITNNSTGASDVVVDIVGYYRAADPVASGAFAAVPAIRIVDSRIGLGLAGALTAPASVPLLGGAGLPTAGVTAVLANVTVTQSSAAGSLTVGDGAVPTIPFDAGQTVAGLMVVPLTADGSLALSSTLTGSVEVVVDLVGYYLG